MAVIDLILNIAALLLWLNWQSLGFVRARMSPASASLATTLKLPQPVPVRRWSFLVGLVALLSLRGFFYHHIGGPVNWVPTLNFGPVTMPFRSDFPDRMALFSLLSFGKLFCCFYLWMLLLSATNTNMAPGDPIHKWIRLHLGLLEPLPPGVKLLLPWVVATCLWALLLYLFAGVEMIPPPNSDLNIWLQGALMGGYSWFALKILLLAVFVIHFANTYVYIGDHVWLDYISRTGRNLLYPLRWLPFRIGKMDFGSLVGIALVLALDHYGHQLLDFLFDKVS